MTVKGEDFYAYMDSIAEGTVKGLCKMMNSSDVESFAIKDKDDFKMLICEYALSVCELVGIDKINVNW